MNNIFLPPGDILKISSKIIFLIMWLYLPDKPRVTTFHKTFSEIIHSIMVRRVKFWPAIWKATYCEYCCCGFCCCRHSCMTVWVGCVCVSITLLPLGRHVKRHGTWYSPRTDWGYCCTAKQIQSIKCFCKTQMRLDRIQALMSAVRPRSYLSPLLVCLGVYLHRKHDSENLINTLHSFCSRPDLRSDGKSHINTNHRHKCMWN